MEVCIIKKGSENGAELVMKVDRSRVDSLFDRNAIYVTSAAINIGVIELN